MHAEKEDQSEDQKGHCLLLGKLAKRRLISPRPPLRRRESLGLLCFYSNMLSNFTRRAGCLCPPARPNEFGPTNFPGFAPLSPGYLLLVVPGFAAVDALSALRHLAYPGLSTPGKTRDHPS